MLRQNKLTQRQITEYNNSRTALRSCGIDLEDTLELHKYLNNMKETGYDPRGFVSLSQKHGSLQHSCVNIEKRRDLAKTELEQLQTHITQKQAKKSQLEPEVNCLQTQANNLRLTINAYNTQLMNAQTLLSSLNQKKQDVITQIGKFLDMTDSQIADLQIQLEIKLIEASINNKMNEMTQKQFADALFRYLTS